MRMLLEGRMGSPSTFELDEAIGSVIRCARASGPRRALLRRSGDRRRRRPRPIGAGGARPAGQCPHTRSGVARRRPRQGAVRRGRVVRRGSRERRVGRSCVPRLFERGVRGVEGADPGSACTSPGASWRSKEAPSPSGPGRVAAPRSSSTSRARAGVRATPVTACVSRARGRVERPGAHRRGPLPRRGRSAAGARRTRLGGRDHRRADRGRGDRGGRALPAAVRAARHQAGRGVGSGIDLIAPLRATGAEVVMLTGETRRSCSRPASSRAPPAGSARTPSSTKSSAA